MKFRNVHLHYPNPQKIEGYGAIMSMYALILKKMTVNGKGIPSGPRISVPYLTGKLSKKSDHNEVRLCPVTSFRGKGVGLRPHSDGQMAQFPLGTRLPGGPDALVRGDPFPS